MPAPKRLLILGGTAEARHLASVAGPRFGAALAVTTSLAGRTQESASLSGAVRRGGFGGAAGLRAYLRNARIDLVIDATHPFATRISASARSACGDAGVPLLAILRPPWQAQPDDCWIDVGSAAEAAALLPAHGKRVFLTIGRRDLAAFAGVEGVFFLIRLIERPESPLPLEAELICQRGPFTVEEERGIIVRHAIDLLITKASGGTATAAKLAAARAAGIPVVMLRRPPLPGGPSVGRIEDAIEWLEDRLATADIV